MKLTGFGELIRRRKRVILLAWIGMTAVAVVGSHLITPSFEATSKIMIVKGKENAVPSSILASSVDVDVAKILAVSRPYVDKMVFRLQLRNEEGGLLKADNLTEGGIVSTVRRWLFPGPNLRTSTCEETDILQIEATSTDPEEVMMMANTLAEIIVDENQAQLGAAYGRARSSLEEQMDSVKKGYSAALGKITDFKKQDRTVSPETEARLTVEKIAELVKAKEDSVIEIAQARAKLDLSKKQLSEQDSEVLSASILKEYPHIAVLKKKLTELKLQMAQAAAGMTKKHPKVLALKEQIDMVKAELKRETEVYRSSAPELAALQGQIVAGEARLKGVNASIDKHFDVLDELLDKSLKQGSLDMELRATPKAYSSLLDSLCQLAVAEASTLSQARNIEPAVRPLLPAHPKKALISVLGMFAGLMLGLCLAFIKEYLDDSIRTAEDVKVLKPMAFVGTVPRFEADRTPLILGLDARDPLCEFYRTIQTRIHVVEHLRKRPLHSLMITSTGREEGKSTTAANLGISIAQDGKKVVIVDMDLDQPSLNTYFDLQNNAGLADVLQNRTSLDEAIQPTSVNGLSIIPNGPQFQDRGALTESEEADQLISSLQARYDLVILDSAPLLVERDALVRARRVDGLVVVLESEKTSRRDVCELMEVMAQAHIEPLGFVLNSCQTEANHESLTRKTS